MQFGRAGLGRIRSSIEDIDGNLPDDSDVGLHQLGTTRMHENPGSGVVDANCRVHGMANLWIAGSSVFPTVGHERPTLNLIALALRLSDEIKRLMV